MGGSDLLTTPVCAPLLTPEICTSVFAYTSDALASPHIMRIDNNARLPFFIKDNNSIVTIIIVIVPW